MREKYQMDNKLHFIASLPPIQSAVTLDGMGDGARCKIDIPANYVLEVIKLQQMYSGQSFKVTIEPLD